jgi:4-oxalomesaconate tautomerase
MRRIERVLKSIPCTLMRGGTSKGLFFNADDLPSNPTHRDRLLLAAMGSPDVRQIDGVGGAHPLTSKVAVISRSRRADADVDYLFLQVAVDEARVSDTQNCGNLLAGVGPWSIENGLVHAAGDRTDVRIHMMNTRSLAVARVDTRDGTVQYQGDARIDGVPGTAAPIALEFLDVAGSSCGTLLPTGHAVDRHGDFEITCIDNGMPVIIVLARDVGVSGAESPAQLEANETLKEKIEELRLAWGPRMNLGDVAAKTVPKVCLVSAPRSGGNIATATFIPHRVHEAIGVLGAVSVATACAIPGSVAHKAAVRAANAGSRVDVEHPSGFFSVDVEVEVGASRIEVRRASLMRTARKLMRGDVFVPGAAWSGAQ